MENSIQSNRESSHITSSPVDPAQDHKTLVTTGQKKSEQLSIEITSATNSANPSRESSPNRPTKPLTKKVYTSRPPSIGASTAAGPSRLRKNGVQDPSSAVSSTNPPSAAAAQRVLSTISVPALYPMSSDPLLKPVAPQKSLLSPDFKEHPPRWPISPRLRSPPPVTLNSALIPRKIDADQGATSHKKSHLSEEEKPSTAEGDSEEPSLVPGMRTPARGVSGASSTLETVQEISQPNTPASGLDIGLEKVKEISLKMSPEKVNLDDQNTPKTIRTRSSIILNEGTSENANKNENKARTGSAAHSSANRSTSSHAKSYISGGLGRGKTASTSEGSTRNMIVETETVSSIPQMAVCPGGPGNVGSIRTKPSSETIRPRKEKRKTVRKPPSVTSGTASSKADIFEAKVASAVDEANSSDSEETFVYESNPPDVNDRPRRFHSRTPSAASMASQVDQRNGVRAIMDGHIVVVKKSMKFTNSSYNNSPAPDSMTGDDNGNGTARSSLGTARGATHHHHLNIRWGRHSGNSHLSLFDNESPFQNAGVSKLPGSSPRFSSQPSSPGLSNLRTPYSGKRFSSNISRYDVDHSADDSLTPLLSTVRSGTSARSRRHHSSIRQLEHQGTRRHHTLLSRCGGCLALCMMVLVVILGAAGFIFATTQPLANVKVLALKNILVSEQDIIFDMQVQARNPNLVAVTIQYTDLAIFANSPYVGSDPNHWDYSRSTGNPQGDSRSSERDAQNLSIEEASRPSTNLELGHVSMLSNPLTFEGSPFSDICAKATSQISIRSPGNQTLPAGSQRWGIILQHEFDLILRGILKYTLPLNQKIRSISVEGQVTVKPNTADLTIDDVTHSL
ncbi:hypothetical protein K3495_g803 [Podosphaera aphanis]|nr:hypothetical protein K3495_g803 [Podosphaera aphanis]